MSHRSTPLSRRSVSRSVTDLPRCARRVVATVVPTWAGVGGSGEGDHRGPRPCRVVRPPPLPGSSRCRRWSAPAGAVGRRRHRDAAQPDGVVHPAAGAPRRHLRGRRRRPPVLLRVRPGRGRRLYAVAERDAVGRSAWPPTTWSAPRSPTKSSRRSATRRHNLFGNQGVEGYLDDLERAMDAELDDLGASGRLRLLRRLPPDRPSAGPGGWAGHEAACRPEHRAADRCPRPARHR